MVGKGLEEETYVKGIVIPTKEKLLSNGNH